MNRYVLTRLGQALLVLWAAYTVTFVVLYALPGDPIALMYGGESSDVTPQQLDDLRSQYGLDQPLPVQYLHQIGAALHGDLGTSVVLHRPVATLIAEAIPPTAQIAAAAFVLALVLGGGLAIVGTLVRRRGLSDALLGLPPLGVAIPSFWLGLMLVQWFSFAIPLFPAVGNKGFSSIVLPAITLAVPTAAIIAQMLSRSLRNSLEQPYVDTARAKGVGSLRVHFRHALRNASLPALTVTGLIVGELLAGAVVTETVFSRPGIGRLTATSVSAQDIPVVQGIVLFAAAVFVLVNLAVDLLYPLLDPRIARRTRTPRTATAAPAPVREPATAGV